MLGPGAVCEFIPRKLELKKIHMMDTMVRSRGYFSQRRENLPERHKEIEW